MELAVAGSLYGEAGVERWAQGWLKGEKWTKEATI